MCRLRRRRCGPRGTTCGGTRLGLGVFMRNAAYLLALVIVVQFCTGCATIVTGAGEDQAVRFASNPRGATVYVDDNPVGQTPVSVRLTRKDDHHIRIEHPGYKTYEKTIESGFNEWIVGNIVIGGLVG